MAYAGTTSTSPNAPALIAQTIGSTGGSGPATWMYKSTHTQAESAAAGFITDGQDLGTHLGDVFHVMGSTTYTLSYHTVNAVSSTGITLTSGLLVSSAS